MVFSDVYENGEDSMRLWVAHFASPRRDVTGAKRGASA
jgi:hypothetical protein